MTFAPLLPTSFHKVTTQSQPEEREERELFSARELKSSAVIIIFINIS